MSEREKKPARKPYSILSLFYISDSENCIPAVFCVLDALNSIYGTRGL